MTECGHYRVLDKRDYRGHKQGEDFIARLDRNAERRAIARGSIEWLGTVTPVPGHHIFPKGWLPSSHHQTTEAREGLFH